MRTTKRVDAVTGSDNASSKAGVGSKSRQGRVGLVDVGQLEAQLRAAHALQFGQRSLHQAQPIGRAAQPDFPGNRKHAAPERGRRLIGIFPVAQPGHPDPPIVGRIAPGLRGVEIDAVVDLPERCSGLARNEVAAVEVAEDHLCADAATDIDFERPDALARLAFDRQRKQIRAFPNAADAAERTEVAEMLQ